MSDAFHEFGAAFIAPKIDNMCTIHDTHTQTYMCVCICVYMYIERLYYVCTVYIFLKVGDINFTKVMSMSVDRYLKSKIFRCQLYLHIAIDDDLLKFVLYSKNVYKYRF